MALGSEPLLQVFVGREFIISCFVVAVVCVGGTCQYGFGGDEAGDWGACCG
jgi:hypothetical protein